MLNSENAVLFVIDVQEAFARVLGDIDKLGANIAVMIEAAKILSVPVVVTEQYPKGLGSTIPVIKEALGDCQYFQKDCFSACGVDDLMSWLSLSGRKQVIVTGIETHVCVSQTCHDLLFNDYAVHLVTDAVDSRIATNKQVGIEKIVIAGGVPTSIEAALFEMLVTSGTDVFKQVQRLIK